MICIFSPGYVLPQRGQASDGVWLEVGGTQGVCSVCAEGRSVALGNRSAQAWGEQVGFGRN